MHAPVHETTTVAGRPARDDGRSGRRALVVGSARRVTTLRRRGHAAWSPRTPAADARCASAACDAGVARGYLHRAGVR